MLWKVVFLCAKWPILSLTPIVTVLLLISRVLSYIIDSASSTSTLSNPLVGFLFLVDLILILLSLDRSLRKIYLFNYLNPFYRCASQAGIVLVVSTGATESKSSGFSWQSKERTSPAWRSSTPAFFCGRESKGRSASSSTRSTTSSSCATVGGV